MQSKFNLSNLDIVRLDEIDSTNTYGLENISKFSNATTIIAAKQLQGRGRFNRRWFCDGTSNVYLSIILKPDNDKYPFSNLTQYLCVVVCSVLEKKYGVIPNIKWPNDILVEGSKISGILCESVSSNGQINGLVLGVGVNLNLKYETIKKIDQKATSLNFVVGHDIDTEKFITYLLEEFWNGYDSFVKKGFEFIVEEYISKCNFLNKIVNIKNNGEYSEYFAIKINNDGSLRIRDCDNKEIDIMTGDLIL